MDEPTDARPGRAGAPRERATAYVLAGLVGIAAAAALIPVGAMRGGGMWDAPGADLAQSLAAHLAFQRDAWRWPLLRAADLYWPHGVAIPLADANPFVSLAAKLLTRALGTGPVDALAPFLVAAIALQPVAAVWALRGLGTRAPVPALVIAAMASAWPALLARLGHVNLCCHAAILVALGLAIRLTASPVAAGSGGRTRRRLWTAAVALGAVAVLVHPYLYLLSIATLAAVPLAHAHRHGVRAAIRRDGPGFAAALVGPVVLIRLLAGTLGGGDKGFGYFSMNLLSPFVPQRSGLFGPRLPVIDATGGQYEGFDYLGAGTIALFALALATDPALRRLPRSFRNAGVVAVGLGLTALALSSRVYAGHRLLLDAGLRPWEDMFGVVRASGRAFWPVGYGLLLLGVHEVSTWRRRAGGRAVLLGAALLQVLDANPLRVAGRAFLGTPVALALPATPPGTRLFAVAPLCTPGDGAGTDRNALLLLGAARAGAALGDAVIGREPHWFNCGRIEADALDWPLLPGEVRAYTTPGARGALRPRALGDDASCRREDGIVLCGRDVALRGIPVPPGPALPALAPGAPPRDGRALAPFLSFGWRWGNGDAWSDGNHASLEARVAPGSAFTVRLDLRGVARRPDGDRPIAIRVDRRAPARYRLRDGRWSSILIPVDASATRDGVLTIGLDADRPIDPAKRALSAPVSRAAIVLRGLATLPVVVPGR